MMKFLNYFFSAGTNWFLLLFLIGGTSMLMYHKDELTFGQIFYPSLFVLAINIVNLIMEIKDFKANP